MIDARKLGMLAALERLGTIAAVAEELHLTAPGVSMQLNSLERELSVTLTERQGRRLALTPAGRLLAAHGRDVLDRLSLAELEVDALRRGATGTYRIAAFPSAARSFVATTWQHLSAEGDLDLSLTTPEPEQSLEMLSNGTTDLAVIHSYSNVARDTPHGIETAPLLSEPVWLAINADDPHAATTIDVSYLANHPWVTPTRDLTCYDMVDRVCGINGFRPRIVAESTDFNVQMALVAAGVGVALMPDLTIEHVPGNVVLAQPHHPIRRHIAAAQRISMRGDPGLTRITRELQTAGAQAIRTTPAA